MKKSNIRYIIFIIFCRVYAPSETPAYEKIALLRARQPFVSLQEGKALEKEIETIKHLHENYGVAQQFPEWYYIFNCLPLGWWQLLYIMSWLMCLAFLVFKKRKGRLFKLGVVLFLISGLSVVVHYTYARHSWGILTKKSALYGSPSCDSFVRASLDYLDEIKIFKKQNSWLQVQACGKIGWIEQENVCSKSKALV